MTYWANMAPRYESLKAEIIEYGKQWDIFTSVKVWLDCIYADILRKPDSFAHRCLVTIVQGLQKQITLFMRQLPHHSDFFKYKNDAIFVYHDQVNPAFATRAPTLHRIEAALVTALKGGKSDLYWGYANTAMYTPHAEIPTTRKRRHTADEFIPTEGWHWEEFCACVDKLEQFGAEKGEVSDAAGGTATSPWYYANTPRASLPYIPDKGASDPTAVEHPHAMIQALLLELQSLASIVCN